MAPKEAALIISQRSARLGAKPDLSQLVLPSHHRDAFRKLLVAAKLRTNRQGFPRNLKSPRSTAISFRILQSKTPNFPMIARNAGTSIT